MVWKGTLTSRLKWFVAILAILGILWFGWNAYVVLHSFTHAGDRLNAKPSEKLVQWERRLNSTLDSTGRLDLGPEDEVVFCYSPARLSDWFGYRENLKMRLPDYKIDSVVGPNGASFRSHWRINRRDEKKMRFEQVEFSVSKFGGYDYGPGDIPRPNICGRQLTIIVNGRKPRSKNKWSRHLTLDVKANN